jgi:hypothetical protein
MEGQTTRGHSRIGLCRRRAGAFTGANDIPDGWLAAPAWRARIETIKNGLFDEGAAPA